MKPRIVLLLFFVFFLPASYASLSCDDTCEAQGSQVSGTCADADGSAQTSCNTFWESTSEHEGQFCMASVGGRRPTSACVSGGESCSQICVEPVERELTSLRCYDDITYDHVDWCRDHVATADVPCSGVWMPNDAHTGIICAADAEGSCTASEQLCRMPSLVPN